MVSSTFTDLEAHRQEVIDAIHGFDFKANVMEDDGARADADVIESSLDFVRNSAAYVAVIGHKYGQTPADATRNPDGLSITELEFNEAQKLGLPTLLFVMGEDHDVKQADVEPSSTKRKKLKAFIDRAKKTRAGSGVERVYAVFSSKEDFTKKATTAIGRLAIYFLKREHVEALAMTGGSDGAATPISTAALHAEFDRIVAVDPDASAEQIFEIVRQNIATRDRQIAELHDIAAEDNRIRALQAAVEEALRSNDDTATVAALIEAEAAINERRESDARSAAGLANIRAEALLRLLDWQGAGRAWREASALLAPFDTDAAELMLWHYTEAITVHGQVFGRPEVIDAAIEQWKNLVDAALPDQHKAAGLQNNLAIALTIQGQGTGGSAGVRLLADAVQAYRSALTVFTKQTVPEGWASIQNNLGNALKTQGERTNGEAGLAVLNDAVNAHRAALTVRTERAMPTEWAMSQNNLGIALKKLGDRTGGEAGLALLAEAADAYRAALTIRTEQVMPIEWAMTQNSLGNALKAQSVRTDDQTTSALLAGAIDAYRAALTVRTRSAMPAQWAMTQNNLGNALAMQAEHEVGAAKGVLFEKAVDAFRAALTIRTEQAMPAKWAQTMGNLGRALENMADAQLDPLSNLQTAKAAICDSLRIFTSEHMPNDHDSATRCLTRIRAKIVALDNGLPTDT
ncbi:DUF4062 domain-containing protein [Sphingomonas sp.]|uniref:DUF4062 domain-containing protein n=1 Tax=Sphingomonas sp. TaxID=28214 RepID=UPI0025D1CD4E|nr:DUF4062 domain-containing protein [Sphingomonas sp.]